MKYALDDLKRRPFQATKEDYQSWLFVHNAVWVDEPVSMKQLMHNDAIWPSTYISKKWMVELENRVIATMHYFENHWQYQEGKYDLDILVDPDYQHEGIGSVLFEYVLAKLVTSTPQASSIVSGTREDMQHAVTFLEHRGFEVTMRWARSRLQLGVFNIHEFAHAIQHVEKQGIRIRSVAELAENDAAWQRKWYEMDKLASADIPSPDPLTEEPFEQFVQHVMDSPHFMPQGSFIAVDSEGNWLGSTELGDNGNKRHLTTPFSAVHPDYRRKGIMTALKVRAIQFALDYGAKMISSANEINNPMYQINLKLGFKPLPHGLTMKKKISSA